MTTTNNGIEFHILPASLSTIEAYDNPESQDPSGYTIKAIIGFGERHIKTEWSVTRDRDGRLTRHAWASADMWIANALDDRADDLGLALADIVEIGDEVIAHANAQE